MYSIETYLKKTSALQKDAGLFVSCHSLSKSGQAMGTRLGCSLTPRANDMNTQTVGRNQEKDLQIKTQQALQV